MLVVFQLGKATFRRMGIGNLEAPELEWAGYALAGSTLLYIGLIALSALGILWSWGLVVVPVILWPMVRRSGALLRQLKTFTTRCKSRISTGPLHLLRPERNLGDVVALATFLVHVAVTAQLWNVHSDFVYHWGLKSLHFFHHGGIDFEFLAQPWNRHLHPEYPNLLPSLSALSAIWGQSFSMPLILNGSSLHLLIAILIVRGALRRHVNDARIQNLGLAFIALSCTMFSIGFRQAGGADWLMVLALLFGTVVLLESSSGAGVYGLGGIIAAFALASKVEGLPLALALIGIVSLRRLTARPLRAPEPRPFASLLFLPLTVGLIQHTLVQWHGLAAQRHFYNFLQDPDRVLAVAGAIWNSLGIVTWNGMAFGLCLLPLLLLRKKTWAAALLISSQFCFYVFIYLTATEPGHLIATSAPRLWFHLVPATWLLIFISLDHGDSSTARLP